MRHSIAVAVGGLLMGSSDVCSFQLPTNPLSGGGRSTRALALRVRRATSAGTAAAAPGASRWMRPGEGREHSKQPLHATLGGVGGSRYVQQKHSSRRDGEVGRRTCLGSSPAAQEGSPQASSTQVQGVVKEPTSSKPLPSIEELFVALDANDGDAEAVLRDIAVPTHPHMHTGELANGFKYVVVNTPGLEKATARLVVLAGSTDERDEQQGMAHVLEHALCKGDVTGFTALHQTVYAMGGRKKVPDYIPDLRTVLDPPHVDGDSFTMAQMAVLSELTMTNTLNYRKQAHLIRSLHVENTIGRRDTIGTDAVIESWNAEDANAFHLEHYRPNNAVLYVVGDVDVPQIEGIVQQEFGSLQNTPEQQQKALTLKKHNAHFPAVTHRWSMAQAEANRTGVPEDMKAYMDLPVMDAVDRMAADTPRIFTHELLQDFTLDIFAKRPIESVIDLSAFRRVLMRRIVVAALQFRVDSAVRDVEVDVPINAAGFDYTDATAEGCAKWWLRVVSPAKEWRDSAKFAVREVRRLGLKGLTKAELDRYSAMFVTDAQRMKAQFHQVAPERQVDHTTEKVMEASANGHTFMDHNQAHEATVLAIVSLTLAEVNEMAAEMCNHMVQYGVAGAAQPSAVIACVPSGDQGEKVSEETLLEVLKEAVEEEVAAPGEIEEGAPSLFSAEEMKDKMERNVPAWKPFVDKISAREAAKEASSADAREVVVDDVTQVVQRRLSNGMAVNFKAYSGEGQRGHMRVIAPGGRYVEEWFGVGSVALGATTLATTCVMDKKVRHFSRDHHVGFDVDASEEFLVIDLDFPTTKARAGAGTVTGMEAAFQLANHMLSGVEWKKDALDAVQARLHQNSAEQDKSLEAIADLKLMRMLSHGDKRFAPLQWEKAVGQALGVIHNSIRAQLTTDFMEVSVVGDFQVPEAEALALKYLGTVPPSERPAGLIPNGKGKERIPRPESDALKPSGPVLVGASSDSSNHQQVHLVDTDERAVVYIGGKAPNRFGLTADDVDVGDILVKEAEARGIGDDETAPQLRSHPLFASAVLDVIEFITNGLLYQQVREEKGLTYEAGFSFFPFERLLGGWYILTCTCTPDKKQEALQACKDVLQDLANCEDESSSSSSSSSVSAPLMGMLVEAAKQELTERQRSLPASSWASMMSGIQMDCIPSKDVSGIRDYASVVNSVMPADVKVMMRYLTSSSEDMLTLVGTSGPPNQDDRKDALRQSGLVL